MTRSLRVIGFVIAGLLLAVAPVVGEGASDATDERVLSLRSEITVLPDASLVVRETIRVRAARRQINRGIYRDFPTRFGGAAGAWFDAPFDLSEVLRDGKPESWRIKEMENGIRAYIGDPERLIEPGEHTYSLAYRTERQLGFFRDQAELHWNVTGYDWTLPIDEAEAIVRLPRGAAGVTLQVATGVRGSQRRDATTSWGADAVATFRATRPLLPGEGLAVIVKWPRGLVREPPEPLHWWWSFLGSNRSAIAGLAGLALVLTYCILAGRLAARRREPEDALRRAAPPEGLSPAAIRFLRTGSCDERALAATLVRMAIKGYLTIEERHGAYTLRRGEAVDTVLEPEEALTADDLLLERVGSIALEPASGMRVRIAVNDLKNVVRIALERFFLVRNRALLLPAVALSLVVLISTLSFEPELKSYTRVLISVLSLFWTMALALLSVQLLTRWRDVVRGRGRCRDPWYDAVSMTVMAGALLLVEIGALALLIRLGSPSYGATLVGVALLIVFLHYHLKGRPAADHGILGQTERFAAGLAAVDAGGGIDPLGAQPGAVAYERFLPHAIALGREREWSAQFAALLARGELAGGPYQPAWWHAGSAAGTWDPVEFAEIVGSGLSAAIAAATAAPECS